MTPDQRLRRRFPYVADLPERPRGWGHEYDQVVDWLIARYGSSRADRWNILGLRVCFHNKADRDAFCEAWGAVPLERPGKPLSGRWYPLRLVRAYFASDADCVAFCEAWHAT